MTKFIQIEKLLFDLQEKRQKLSDQIARAKSPVYDEESTRLTKLIDYIPKIRKFLHSKKSKFYFTEKVAFFTSRKDWQEKWITEYRFKEERYRIYRVLSELLELWEANKGVLERKSRQKCSNYNDQYKEISDKIEDAFAEAKKIYNKFSAYHKNKARLSGLLTNITGNEQIIWTWILLIIVGIFILFGIMYFLSEFFEIDEFDFVLFKFPGFGWGVYIFVLLSRWISAVLLKQFFLKKGRKILKGIKQEYQELGKNPSDEIKNDARKIRDLCKISTKLS